MKNQFRLLSFAMALIIGGVFSSCKKKEEEPIVIGTSAKVSFSTASAEVSEKDASQAVAVTLGAAAEKDLSVIVNVSGTAKAGTDFSASPEVKDNKITLAIAKGASEASFTITTKDNTDADGNKTIVLALVSNSDVKLGDSKEITLTIKDDEEGETPVAAVMSLEDVLKKYKAGESVDLPAGTKIEGIVTAGKGDNVDSKNIVIQDATGGIVVRFKEATDLVAGDKVVIDVSGFQLGDYNGSIQINNVEKEKVEKKASGESVTPKEITIEQLLSGDFQGQLVKISGVSIKEADGTKTLNGNTTGTDGSKEFTIRVDKGDFPETVIPAGSGSIVGIADVYKDTKQLRPRNIEDINFTDSASATVSFEATTLSVNENATEAATLTIKLSKASDKDLSIPVTVAGTAAATTDYTTDPAVASGKITVAIAKGATSATIKVTPVDNSEAVTENKTVTFEIGAVDGAELGTDKMATLTIKDDESVDNTSFTDISAVRALRSSANVAVTEEIKIKGIVTTANYGTSSFYVQDATGGIQVYIGTGADAYARGNEVEITLAVGDSVKIHRNSGPIQISAKADASLTITDNGASTLPAVAEITFAQLKSGDYEGKLVKVSNLAIKEADGSATFVGKKNYNMVEGSTTDCSDAITLRVYTDNSELVGKTIPEGKGAITGVADNFRGTPQLAVPNSSSISLTGTFDCPSSGGSTTGAIFSEDFNDKTLGKFTAFSVSGTQEWVASDQSAGTRVAYAKMSGFASGASNENEDWLVSSAIDLSSTTNPVLTFETARGYTGNDIEVYVSTDYSGSGNPSSATWTQLTPTLYSGTQNWQWTASGNIDLSSYKNATTYIAFKYTSTSAESATWEVDNIVISDN